MSTQLADLLIGLTFLIGYLFIIFETRLKVNKSASALLMATFSWMFFMLSRESGDLTHASKISEGIGEVSQIIFFLLGAMALVELIDVHRGFRVITDLIQTNSKKKLLWFLGFFTFFLSAILDNLTTTIVMVSLLRKLVEDKRERMLLAGMVVIAANAGGAWTPIGDVTTTMLWIKGNITTFAVMKSLFLPSFVSLLVALLLFGRKMKGKYPGVMNRAHKEPSEPGARLVFFLGVGALIFVPIFKAFTGLPPFMGMLVGLGAVWVTTDLMHGKKEARGHLRIPHILTRIDTSGILFFLGILLCISAMDAAGLLEKMAHFLDEKVQNITLIATIIGLISAVVDNVPLVAAGIGMYDVQTFPVDSKFWQLLAYCAGTGGSVLIIGSAAGVALMSLEKIDFVWYLRKVSWIALLSYFAGIAVYLGLVSK